MHVADATAADTPELTRLINTAYREVGAVPGWTDERLLLAGPRTDAALVADDMRSGRMLALRSGDDPAILACLSISVADDGAWYLSSIAVEPRRQAAGLGRALLAEAERQAREAGAPALRMSVIQQRTALIAWYERRGFGRTGATLPFPYGETRVGRPLRNDLRLVVLEKPLRITPDRSSAP